ncbi:hypothetical protein MBLNU459_g6223t1 [Dothideomycetes sp. NU459]
MDIGSPWNHPCVVCTVNPEAGTVTIYQVTSKDLIQCTKDWKWAQRYVPIAHINDKPGKPRHPNGHEDGLIMPILKLQGNSTMEKPSNVNIDTVLTVEWANLCTLGNRASPLILTGDSMTKLRCKQADFANLVAKYPQMQAKSKRPSNKRQLSSRSPSPQRKRFEPSSASRWSQQPSGSTCHPPSPPSSGPEYSATSFVPEWRQVRNRWNSLRPENDWPRQQQQRRGDMASSWRRRD